MLAILQRLLFAALIAGVAGGLVASLGQAARVTPLILEAETFETAGGHQHDHGDDAAAGAAHQHGEAGAAAWAPADGFERVAFTVGANLLVGIGFSLLLVAAFVIRGEIGWREGLLWGCGGFAAFVLAPSLGLPPELPGSAAAELGARQGWWIATATATAAGLGLLLLNPHWLWRIVGLALLALPHVVGAPHPDGHGGAVPAELAAQFVSASLVVGLVFWLVLGAASALAYQRLVRPVITSP